MSASSAAASGAVNDPQTLHEAVDEPALNEFTATLLAAVKR